MKREKSRFLVEICVELSKTSPSPLALFFFFQFLSFCKTFKARGASKDNINFFKPYKPRQKP